MGYTYKNITDQEHTIPGIGIVKPGETIPTEQKLENKNFQEVSTAPIPPAQPKPQPQIQQTEGGKE